MDAIHYKVRDDSGSIVSKAIYNVIGISNDGHKKFAVHVRFPL
jgi:transposase-like protein